MQVRCGALRSITGKDTRQGRDDPGDFAADRNVK